MKAAASFVLAVGITWCASACGDDPKRPLGANCTSNTQCESGLCVTGVCLDPDADEDVDGLINRIEAGLETNPFSADSDGDGKRDADEVGDVAAPTDTDGDGKSDARESATADVDSDCIPDELDANDAFSDLPSDRFPEACGTGKPVPGDKPSQGSCDAIKEHLGGSCAEPFASALADCFDPSGCMSFVNTADGVTSLRWENGARVDRNPATEEMSMYASNGRLCARATVRESGDTSTTIDYVIDDQRWTLVVTEGTNELDLTCPNGQHVTLTEAESADISACQGGSDYEFCEGTIPGSCRGPEDCSQGLVCCPLSDAVSYCLPSDQCPQ